MRNNRVYYPVNYIAIGQFGAASGVPVHGGQSAEVTTNFNVEQVFELGQLEIYENIENLPDVEVTAEKVLDGYPLMYHLATSDATSTSLVNRTNRRCDLFYAIFNDDQENSSGTAMRMVYCSGMYIDSLTYSIPVEGNCTESLTLVGNDKRIIASGTIWEGGTGFTFEGHFEGGDSPLDEVQRRQHVIMGAAPTGSIWPSNLPGITVENGSGYNTGTAEFDAHIQDVEISVSLGRTDLFELGRRGPYFRYAEFPTAVDCTINVTAGGSDPSDGVDAIAEGVNQTDEPIIIKLSDSTVFDLGTRNRLVSVTNTAGPTDGGVATIAYNFQNFNILTVTQDQDPAGL